MEWLRANRYQLLRRVVQASVLLLFVAGARDCAPSRVAINGDLRND